HIFSASRWRIRSAIFSSLYAGGGVASLHRACTPQLNIAQASVGYSNRHLTHRCLRPHAQNISWQAGQLHTPGSAPAAPAKLPGSCWSAQSLHSFQAAFGSKFGGSITIGSMTHNSFSCI